MGNSVGRRTRRNRDGPCNHRVIPPSKLARIGAIANVPGFSRNLLSTMKAAEQWEQQLDYIRKKTFLGFPGEESLVLKLFVRKGLFSATGVRQVPSLMVAL